MNPPANLQLKAKPDDTRARIIETAETLFRRLGYAKNAAADIPAQVKKVHANSYPLFFVQERQHRGDLSALLERARGAGLGGGALAWLGGRAHRAAGH